MTVYLRLVILLWAVLFAVWFVSSFGVKKNRRSRNAWTGLLTRVALLGFLVLAFRSPQFEQLVQRSAQAPGPALGVLGVALCALGVSFAIWARLRLGKNWGMPMSVKQDADLVTTGPYAFVRHPIYTGILLAMIGSALVIGFWYAIAVAVFAVYFAWSAKTEEKVMLEQFSDRYRDYMRRTKMLIPFVL